MPLRYGRTVWWGVFPDVFAFGPSVIVGLGVGLAGLLTTGDGNFHRVRLGLPLYPAVHSLVVFLVVFGLTTLFTKRFIVEMLGWPLHILIDIPTHSLGFHATRFLWPLSEFRLDGIDWWEPWLWRATYAALAAVFLLLWWKGWLSRRRLPHGEVPDPEGVRQG